MPGPAHLTRALLLETPGRVADGAGGFARQWQAMGTLWAEVVPGRGAGAAGADAPLSRVPYRITVRAAPPGAPARPRPGQRFRDGARLFRILAVTERDARARFLTCFAEEELVP